MLLGLTEAEFHDRYVYNTRTKRKKRRQQRYAQRDTRQPDKETSYRYENRRRKRKNPFKLSAKKKYEDDDLEEAIEDYEQALLLDPQDAEIHIDMAAGYSLLENKDKAYYHIKKAKELGWSKTGEILEKDDFAFIRIQKDFETFRASGYTAAETKTLDAPKEDLLQDDLLLSQLNKLKNMRERGLLSEKEFIQEKEKLFKK
jgi:tetratricopeptide (TPR) repeat protein